MRTATSDRHGGWGLIVRLADADGGAPHPFRHRLIEAQAPLRDLADLVHALCAVHGRVPGIADQALGRAGQPDALPWLRQIDAAFAVERGYLAQLVAAAGHVPSTAGHAQTEAALIGQRHALGLLARSDRAGCATGAIAALVLDWRTIRPVLDRAAERFGLAATDAAFPPLAETATAIDALLTGPAIERAMAFGAQQLLAQQRGLWSLLEARAAARG